MLNKRPIIITGCGASGTRYTSKFLTNIGLSIPHEILGGDGMSSWYFAPGYRVLGSPFRSSLPLRLIKTVFSKHPFIFHQVRHPLNVISSIQNANIRSNNYIRDIIGFDIEEEGILKFYMLYWLHWNILTERISIGRIKIENFKKDVENILILTGNKRLVKFIPRGLELVNPKENSKKHGKKYIKRTWKDLFKTDRGITIKIIDLANKYGYKINKVKLMEEN